MTADNIEDVTFKLSDAGDSVTVDGDFDNTALAAATIMVIGGSAADTVDASQLVSQHDIVFEGNGGADSFTGGAGNDSVNGGGADDTITYKVGGGTDTVDGGTEGASGDLLVIDNTTVVGGASGVSRAFVMQLAPGNTITPADNKSDILVTVDGGGANGQVTADEIEDVTFKLSALGDNVTINGNFSATALDTSTITVTGGAGADTVNAAA